MLDKETIKLCEKTLDYDNIKKRFTVTFNLLYGLLGENTFKKYSNNKYQGPVLASAFKVIATGVFNNITKIISNEDKNDWIKERISQIYEDEIFKKNTTPGVRAIPRYKDLSEFGMKYFKP